MTQSVAAHGTRVFSGSDGVTIIADVHGDPSHPPVIFLHGGGQTRHAWGDAAERFAEKGYYTLTLDLRGHGESGWAPDGRYEIEHFVADLRAVLVQLHSPTLPALVGASLGGVTALIAIGRAEQPIARSLVLVDIVPRMNPEGAMKIQAFMKGNPEGFASLEDAADAVSAYMPHRPRPKDVSGLQKNLRLRDGRYFWHWDPRFMMQDSELDPEYVHRAMEDAARCICIPTLLVRGSLSEIVDDAGVEALQQTIAGVELIEVQGAGHMVAGDKNNVFDVAVLEFLQRHDQ